MKTTNFKTGDWGFCEFKLQQIMEMKDENITSVSDGFFRLGSSSLNDRFFPIDMTTKVISDSVSSWRDKFHRDCKNLNYPDINRKLIQMWVDMVEAKDDEQKLKKMYEQLDEFGRSVMEKARDLKFVEVDGVNIFR